jgi:hypothetical protein
MYARRVVQQRQWIGRIDALLSRSCKRPLCQT